LHIGNTYAQNTITGTITDENNEPLIGANVVIAGTTIGTATDIDGKFTLKTGSEFPFDIEVSYLGYPNTPITITKAGDIGTFSMIEAVNILNDIVISASRKREKVQEAPASISVISARKLANTANATDATRNLISTPGVQIQQQSANRINISMRGSAGLFGTSVFPIMDYRSLVGPGIGTFQSDAAGISNIDLQKIEVVRGAGSALYGPGVTQGVVHFITKNPIDFPGTSVELVGGELNTLGVKVRHAGKNANDKFGYKINAQFKRGNEFTLDPDDEDDAMQIARFTTTGIFQPAVTNNVVDVLLPPEQLITFEELDDDGDGNPMQNDWFNAAANATLEFRPKNNLGITVSGGYNQASSVFYNEQGEGLSQAVEFWGQARVQAGGLFAQIFSVVNDGGTKDNPTFLYQTGLRTPVGRTQLESQVQYNFDTESFLNSSWTAGVDFRFAGQDTENLVYGRNEDDDSYSVFGGYVQGKFKPLTSLDLVLAARYDRFNFIDEGAFAPRAALVYKINPKHTLRASFNRANTTVSNLQLNIDFPLSTIIPGLFDIWLYGNKTTQTFSENPMISWFNPAIPAVPVGTPGLPLGVPFGAVNEGVTAQLEAGIPDIGPLVANVLRSVNPLTLGTTGSLSPGFNIFDGSPLGVIDAPISTISIIDAWEIGYKGLIANKLGVTFDVYHLTEKKNSQFTAISPAYILSGLDSLPNDLGRNVALAAAQPLEQALLEAGLPVEEAAATTQALLPSIMDAYAAGGDAFLNTPDPATQLSVAQIVGALPFHATVQSNQSPVTGATHLGAGYRTFDERAYFGADVGLEYYINNDLSVFGNYSWVEKVQFMQNVVGVEGAPLPTYLNIPKNKFRIGANYTPELGIKGSMSFQHDDSYFANAGQYTGDTEVRNLVDASVGYTFDFGLSIGVSATNVLNNEYRYLPNMPKIGRRVLAKLTYDIGGGK